MLTKKRIGVLMGGRSAEREISLQSGRAIMESLKRQGASPVSIDVGPDIAERLAEAKIQLAFNALHGRGGEDGTIQGLLESLGIPYTGSGVLASALGMDKAMTKKILVMDGIPTPESRVIRGQEDADKAVSELASGKGLPVVVKPNSEGSTLGVTIVDKPEALEAAIEASRKYDPVVLVESYIEGREITVGVLDGEALPVIEVVAEEDFYDFKAKYTKGKTEYRVPAPLSDEKSEAVQKLAVRTHELLGCRGATRVDFRMDQTSRPFVLEINTVPGMTETSLLPKAAAAAGITYDELVSRIVRSAAEGRAA
ncbi:MAG TPA: D-alanine--D-alanine ligase [Nitrospiria bacterium]